MVQSPCYGHVCCFPNCCIEKDNFLIGAHILRWSDSKGDRENIANGLCLCLMHDKAFEAGLFILDIFCRVIPTQAGYESPWAKANIVPFSGRKIKVGAISPAEAFLSRHRERVGYQP